MMKDSLHFSAFLHEAKGQDILVTAALKRGREGGNAREQYTKAELGTCVDQETNYDLNNGSITDIISRNINDSRLIQSYNYAWLTNGNLEHRRDNVNNLTETFDYDAYNRLTNAQVNNIEQLGLTYKPFGNIQSKTGLGTYAYDFVKPHALTEIPGTPESISQNYQSIDYTPFDKVNHISEKETVDSENDLISLDIGYGSSHERVWQKFNDHINGTSLEKHYFNSIYEQQVDEKGNTKQLHYIVAPTGLFAIFTVENEEDLTMNYLLKDHLGSINFVLDAQGNVEQELNFDAWGRRRDPSTWQYYTSTTTVPAPMFSRGFTMHEHLDAFKLINMNGRMYDPVVARFLSPDPLIQFPENSQSYNSYSYVLNNPLRFTDPSGFLTSGDSTATQQSNMTGITTKALNVVDSNDDSPTDASSFNTEETQAGKTMLPVGVVNINLIESRTTNNVAGNTAVSPPRGAIPENLQRCGMCHDPRGMYYDQLGGYREVFWQNVFFVAGFAYTGLSAPLLAARTSTQSLGTGRTAVKQWLQRAGNLERGQLIKDIEGVGFKKVFDGKGMMHFERGGMKIRLDPTQPRTPFNHMHLNYGGNKSAYDIFLSPVNYKSPGAHIPIR